MIKQFVLFIVFILSFSGCATFFKGYQDEVIVKNYTEDLKITNQHGIPIPVIELTLTKSKRSGNPYVRVPSAIDTVGKEYVIFLDVSERQILTMTSESGVKIVSPIRKIGWGWLVLDTVFGFFPAFIDATTGAWYHYEPVSAEI